MKNTLRYLQLPLFVAAPFLFSACAGANAADDDALVSESASLALSSEDATADQSTADALGGMADADTRDAADEAIDGETRADEVPGEGALSCDFSAVRAAIIQRFDDDGDGRLDATERAALRAELDGRGVRTLAHRLLGIPGRRPHYHVWARIRWAFDVDDDHQLSAEERAAMVSALEERCERRRERLVARYDADGDGTLSRAELAQAVEDARAAFQAHRQEILAQYDTNQDGVLDDGERAALRADRQARIAAHRAEVLAEYDANGDGQLDAAERDALKAAIRQRIAEGPSA